MYIYICPSLTSQPISIDPQYTGKAHLIQAFQSSKPTVNNVNSTSGPAIKPTCITSIQ